MNKKKRNIDTIRDEYIIRYVQNYVNIDVRGFCL